jgi:hypothetical protein
MENNDAKIEIILKEKSPEIRLIVLVLRDLIHRIAPKASEKVHPGWKTIAYDGMCCSILAFKSHVNIQFGDGVILDDPLQLLEGTGKKMRHIKIQDRSDIEKAGIRELIGNSLGITS